MAEQETSDGTFAVTLTYAGDVPESVAFRYRDVQNLFKRLRFAGYEVRYMCVGEFGSAKGRCHWHVILFFRGKVPEVRELVVERSSSEQITLERRIQWKFWPHGFSYFQKPDYGGFAYVLKYALKDQERQEASLNVITMSKKPPLGYDWFMQRVERFVEARLAPQGAAYAFMNVMDRRGRRRAFWLGGRMRELFIEAYQRRWRETYGTEPPFSEFVERYEDALVRRTRIYSDEEILARWRYERETVPRRTVDYVAADKLADELGHVVVPGAGGGILLTVLSDGSSIVRYGEGEVEICGDVGRLNDVLYYAGVLHRDRCLAVACVSRCLLNASNPGFRSVASEISPDGRRPGGSGDRFLRVREPIVPLRLS